MQRLSKIVLFSALIMGQVIQVAEATDFATYKKNARPLHAKLMDIWTVRESDDVYRYSSLEECVKAKMDKLKADERAFNNGKIADELTALFSARIETKSKEVVAFTQKIKNSAVREMILSQLAADKKKAESDLKIILNNLKTGLKEYILLRQSRVSQYISYVPRHLTIQQQYDVFQSHANDDKKTTPFPATSGKALRDLLTILSSDSWWGQEATLSKLASPGFGAKLSALLDLQNCESNLCTESKETTFDLSSDVASTMNFIFGTAPGEEYIVREKGASVTGVNCKDRVIVMSNLRFLNADLNYAKGLEDYLKIAHKKCSPETPFAQQRIQF